MVCGGERPALHPDGGNDKLAHGVALARSVGSGDVLQLLQALYFAGSYGIRSIARHRPRRCLYSRNG